MAKHPHKLILIEGRTWRCVLEGCTWFVHRGLAHVIPGKNLLCWECGEIFRADEDVLKDVMPKCISCRTGSGAVSMDEMTKIVERQLVEARKKLLQTPKVIVNESDTIEVIDEHAPDCESYTGGMCTCQ